MSDCDVVYDPEGLLDGVQFDAEGLDEYGLTRVERVDFEDRQRDAYYSRDKFQDAAW